jgi:4-alpha-glucanotransferase
MNVDRSAGVLVHPTSLPGPFGCGDLGPSAVRFLDWAAEAGLTVWQLLPLGPTGPGASPYDCQSAFAGNPLLISLERLVHSGLLPSRSLDPLPDSTEDRADFDLVARVKHSRLRDSWKHFRSSAAEETRREFDAFVDHPGTRHWLEDWSLYAALKEHHGGASWFEWDEEIRLRRPPAVRRAARDLREEIAYQRYLQFLFCRQWHGVRRAAHRRGIALYGDVPFYVAHDSADVWSHRELFRLDEGGRASKVAGVPPDYFSETGQRWGNPVYCWDRLAERGHDWWIDRIRANLRLVDLLRLDHFRGFAAYWEIDADEATAAGGRWTPGPGRSLFDAIRGALGSLPLVAEDLGLITPDVETLREELGLPGMHVLQFGFEDEESVHHPSHHRENAVVYTGTHDNDTLRGWFDDLEPPTRDRVLSHLDCGPGEMAWRMIEQAYRSPARLAIVPLQDLLGLGSEARMNVPGVKGDNWRWRVRFSRLTLELAAELRALRRACGR